MVPHRNSSTNPSRGESVMLHAGADQRSHRRAVVRMPIVLRLVNTGSDEHKGLLRDVSRGGLFFYSDLRPREGALVAFSMRMTLRGAASHTIECLGRVMRVEQPQAGAAIGVAVSLEQMGTLPAAIENQ